MSSSTAWKVGEVGKMIRSNAMPSPVQDSAVSGPTNHMSQRQMELDRLWRYFRCSNYDGRKFDWNGHENLGHIEHDIVAHTGNIPPGFYDAGASFVPLKFRSPSNPFFLGKVIVWRFTSLLFSSKRHPRIECDDPATEDWLTGFAEATRLWSQMIQARNYGGAMGSVGLGFKFVKGKPHVEVHDPRWCTPEFSDRTELIVAKFEKLYQYSLQVRNREGEWEEKWFWYRRVIDAQKDRTWPKVPVEANEEPNWEKEVSSSKEHNFGFCPIVWIQNQKVDDDIDGDPDCHGCFENIEDIDQLWSQSSRGVKANCDPTVIISSDSDFDEIKKGSGSSLQVEKGGSASYMEMSGDGIDKAMALAEKLEEKVATVSRVMLDRNEGGPSRTVEEVEHNYSSMIEQADVLREQYGERGVKRLLEMVLKAVRGMAAPRVDRSGVVSRIVTTKVTLPKKRIIDEETGRTKAWVERVIGVGEQIELNWPQYFTPNAQEVGKSVEAASKAKEAGLIDQSHAVGYVSEYFGVENKADMIRRIEAEQAKAQEAMMGGAMGPGPAEEVAARSEWGNEEF